MKAFAWFSCHLEVRAKHQPPSCAYLRMALPPKPFMGVPRSREEGMQDQPPPHHWIEPNAQTTTKTGQALNSHQSSYDCNQKAMTVMSLRLFCTKVGSSERRTLWGKVWNSAFACSSKHKKVKCDYVALTLPVPSTPCRTTFSWSLFLLMSTFIEPSCVLPLIPE